MFSRAECGLCSLTVNATGHDPETLLKSIVYTLCAKNYLFLGAVKYDNDTISNDQNNMTVLVASLQMLDQICDYEQNTITVDEFLAHVDSGNFKPVYVDNFISLHSLKRLFITKNRDTTQEFRELLSVLQNRHGVHFYVADYIDMSSFNSLPEENLPNVLKGIVKSGEDYTSPSKEHPHGVLVSFQMNGTVGNLQVKSYWLSVEPIESCVPQFDRETFNWIQITAEEYLTNMKQQGELYTEYLH